MEKQSHIRHFTNPPIAEAVLNINCSMPPDLDLPRLKESIQKDLSDYPNIEPIYFDPFSPESGEQERKNNPEVKGFIMRTKDRIQMVQVRSNGFAFNRLAPYTSLGDYLVEIKRTWNIFKTITKPRSIRSVMLRYINRIMLPLSDGKCEIERYLRIQPQLPDSSAFELRSFFNQYSAIDKATGHLANVITTPHPVENNQLPLILDIEVRKDGDKEPEDWTWMENTINSLRSLKNIIFNNTLSEECLGLFQQVRQCP